MTDNEINTAFYALLKRPTAERVETAKRAYRIGCHRHHPDHGGDAEAFKRLQSAFAHALAAYQHCESKTVSV